jgi:hypothetical protein
MHLRVVIAGLHAHTHYANWMHGLLKSKLPTLHNGDHVCVFASLHLWLVAVLTLRFYPRGHNLSKEDLCWKIAFVF